MKVRHASEHKPDSLLAIVTIVLSVWETLGLWGESEFVKIRNPKHSNPTAF